MTTLRKPEPEDPSLGTTTAANTMMATAAPTVSTMREMRQERWRKRRRIAHRAVTAKATNPYTDPVTIPNSRYLLILVFLSCVMAPTTSSAVGRHPAKPRIASITGCCAGLPTSGCPSLRALASCFLFHEYQVEFAEASNTSDIHSRHASKSSLVVLMEKVPGLNQKGATRRQMATSQAPQVEDRYSRVETTSSSTSSITSWMP
mmetsp:Transcript_3840/g.11097  ORF Transcript_3840/g.11097 Transcript_3840/m.11097 type:complete len:204 (+) Transcript_3840:1156-1767(+)